MPIHSRLEPWLTQVFRVLGGYALATGVLTIALSATAFRARDPVAFFGVIIAGASSIGLMVMANFALDSRFKWLLLGAALVWLLSLIAYAAEEWTMQSASSRARSREREPGDRTDDSR